LFIRCKYQVNDIMVSNTVFPQRNSFELRKGFCLVAKKLFERPCFTTSKRAMLDENYPRLCSLIQSRQNFIKNCDHWPQQFFGRQGEKFQQLLAILESIKDTE
jgi:hypothetical protein